MALTSVIASAVCILGGCAAPIEAGATPEASVRVAAISASGLPVPSYMTLVSVSNPGDDAGLALSKCQIGIIIPVSNVVGMGKVATGSDVLRFVGLTGLEPQLKDAGPMWVIQVKGEIRMPSSGVWTDPTCIVTTNDFGWFGTGPITDSAGSIIQPLPAAKTADLGLPELAP